MSLKTRNSEKVPYSKSSCSRLVFCNQLIKYSVLDITLSNDKDSRKNPHSITVVSFRRTHLTLFYKPLPPLNQKDGNRGKFIGSNLVIFYYKEFENFALFSVLD